MDRALWNTFHRIVHRYRGAIIGSSASRERFFGSSENLVKTQTWIAVSVYVLIAIIRKRLGILTPLHTMLQILSVTLFEKNPALRGTYRYQEVAPFL